MREGNHGRRIVGRRVHDDTGCRQAQLNSALILGSVEVQASEGRNR